MAKAQRLIELMITINAKKDFTVSCSNGKSR